MSGGDYLKFIDGEPIEALVSRKSQTDGSISKMSDEQVALKMMARLKQIKRMYPNKPQPDIEMMLGMIEVVRACDNVELTGAKNERPVK